MESIPEVPSVSERCCSDVPPIRVSASISGCEPAYLQLSMNKRVNETGSGLGGITDRTKHAHRPCSMPLGARSGKSKSERPIEPTRPTS